jgi:hypothetical protein
MLPFFDILLAFEYQRLTPTHTTSEAMRRKMVRALPTSGIVCNEPITSLSSQERSSGASFAVNPSLKANADTQSIEEHKVPIRVPALRNLSR